MAWLILVLVMGATGPAGAGDDEAEDLSRVRDKIEAMRKSKTDMESRSRSLDQELAAIETEMGGTARAIGRLEKEIGARGQRIAALQQDRNRLQALAERHRRNMGRHARAAYAAGRQDWLKLVLNQEDPSRLARVLAYYRYLNRARGLEVRSLARDSEVAANIQGELRLETEQLRSDHRELERRQAGLMALSGSRRTLILALAKEIRASDAELERLHQDERRLEDLLRTLRSSGDEGMEVPEAAPVDDGHRACPIKGRLLAPFGSAKAHGYWDGVLIEAAEGTPVRAAASGKVVFADWMRGYGLLAIIDHGNGIMSLYAFNQSLLKGAGDIVKAGQPVAAVGASGGQRSPALYFGLREQGRAVDPMPWCRGPE